MDRISDGAFLFLCRVHAYRVLLPPPLLLLLLRCVLLYCCCCCDCCSSSSAAASCFAVRCGVSDGQIISGSSVFFLFIQTRFSLYPLAVLLCRIYGLDLPVLNSRKNMHVPYVHCVAVRPMKHEPRGPHRHESKLQRQNVTTIPSGSNWWLNALRLLYGLIPFLGAQSSFLGLPQRTS